ncbi:hypothetical protein SCH4B_4791 [Ruegeria sp. TrichCH4B]|nr:hypothetical protein SCH4B_4791 [Ruegeria sp. TrichCH4B]
MAVDFGPCLASYASIRPVLLIVAYDAGRPRLRLASSAERRR